jgi:hypothetical protein
MVVATEKEEAPRQEARQGQGGAGVADGGVPEAAAARRPQPLRRPRAGARAALQGPLPQGTGATSIYFDFTYSVGAIEVAFQL